MAGPPKLWGRSGDGEPGLLRETLLGLLAEYSEVIERCTRAGFASIDKTIQREARLSAKNLGTKLIQAKADSVAAGDEFAANFLLAIIFTLRAMHGELGMWLAIKDEQAERAWDRLIEAQSLVKAALRAYRGKPNLSGYLDRLHGLEELLFPRQLFFSAGMVVTSVRCSICGEEYGECPHVAGRPYMGSLCCEVVTEVSSIPEISLVEEPLDKGCRARYSSWDGVKTDLLTGLPLSEGNEEDRIDRAEPGFTRFGGYAIRFGDDTEAFPED